MAAEPTKDNFLKSDVTGINWSKENKYWFKYNLYTTIYQAFGFGKKKMEKYSSNVQHDSNRVYQKYAHQ